MQTDPDAFADEELPTRRGYPSAYQPRPLEAQVATLRQVFPRLGAVTLDGARALPDGAEAWFAVPDWRRLYASYNEAAVDALTRLGESRPATMPRLGRLGGDYLRPHARTAAMFEGLPRAGDSGLIAVAAQFGVRHRGRSVRRARVRFAPGECGLGIFAVAAMLLTHPERIAQFDQLYLDCAGDEYSASDEQQFSEAPYFRFLDGRLAFGTSWIGYTDVYFGSVSAFLPA